MCTTLFKKKLILFFLNDVKKQNIEVQKKT